MLKKVAVEDFSEIYPRINKFIVESGDTVNSRNGVCKEVLDFTTTLLNPRKRCVGVKNRGMNIFFLIAEAIWIAAGHKDVEWLDIFNSNMKNYSDDGKVFHAPYGYRLRHWGVASENENEDITSLDQVAQVIKILSNDPNSRQAVMSIWNTDFDLARKTKDLPCNDMVMLKVRKGELYVTIANRSNDLHLGLPTNVFQFSFLSEIIASCLGLKLGTQTHHSQSLHIYTEMNDIWRKMMLSSDNEDYFSLYDYAKTREMDFKFTTDVPQERLYEIDYYLNLIINNIKSIWSGKDENWKDISNLRKFSSFLTDCFSLLKTFVIYKKILKISKDSKDFDKNQIINRQIDFLNSEFIIKKKWDFFILALNYFYARSTEKHIETILGNL